MEKNEQTGSKSLGFYMWILYVKKAITFHGRILKGYFSTSRQSSPYKTLSTPTLPPPPPPPPVALCCSFTTDSINCLYVYIFSKLLSSN